MRRVPLVPMPHRLIDPWPNMTFKVALHVGSSGCIEGVEVWAHHRPRGAPEMTGVAEDQIGPFDDAGDVILQTMITAATNATHQTLPGF